MARIELVAGVDEAGRGPLAGPVVAAAVVFSPGRVVDGLRDSKKLSPEDRESLAARIMDRAVTWTVQCAGTREIDALNILCATMLAMQRAVNSLILQPNRVLVDGNRAPGLRGRVETIIGGDDLEPAICAASILAKVHRDRLMARLDVLYPGYGFSQHKGYGTRQHLDALRERGVTDVHRRSFAPVRNILEQSEQ